MVAGGAAEAGSAKGDVKAAVSAKRKFRQESILQVKHEFSRRLSSLTLETVTSTIGVKYSTWTAIIYTMNMVLGTGPLTLPYAFAQSGLLLGSIFLILCATLAYITATYVIETLAVGNAVLFESAEESLLANDMAPGEDALSRSASGIESVKHSIRHRRPDKVYKIRERIEMGDMGDRMLPGGMHALLYVLLFLHTTGTLCVYAVSVISSVEAMVHFDGIGPLGKHEVVVLCWTIVVVPLCFADMQKLKSMQSVVIVLRVLTVIVMAASSAQVIRVEGPKEVPMVNVNGIPSLYANAVLAFMVHHSLPGILSPLEEQADAKKVIATSYGLACFMYIGLTALALGAFGSSVPALFNLAFDDLPPAEHFLPECLGKFLDAYPLTILGVYPIVGITLRNNLLVALHLSPPNPKKGLMRKDVLGTLAVTIPPAVVAYLTSDVQVIVSFFAGYFGLSLMLVAPVMLVVWARRNIHEDEDEQFALKSQCVQVPILATVVIAWFGAITFNTYRLFFM